MLTKSEIYHENQAGIEDYDNEKKNTKEQLEQKLIDKVKFIEHDGKKTNHRWMDGEQVMITVDFEPTNLGKQIKDLLREYGHQYGTNNAWACIRGYPMTDAYELTKKYNRWPEGKNVSHDCAGHIYELGVDLSIDCGTTNNEQYGDELAEEVEAAVKDMKELAQKIRSLGVDCVYDDGVRKELV